MRIGFNPNKDKIKEVDEYFHQVIIPVYIPNKHGYFKDSFQILVHSLESLFKTSHTKTFFTIVNNGSCKEVVDYLQKLFIDNKINELIHTTNIGKLNAILKGINGHKFKLITISDADVLFLNNWQEETYKIFDNFPKAGLVSPVPSSKVLKHYTHNIILENFFSKKLKFTKVLNPEALVHFAKSIGNVKFYNSIHLKKNLTIQKNNIKAVVGAGHFVATYRGTVFKSIKYSYSNYNLGGNSETEFLDKPISDSGLWRLSTEDNYCYHMGNCKEKWMEVEMLKLKKIKEDFESPILSTISNSKINLKINSFLFTKIISKSFLWKLFLKYKGLNKIEVNEY
mgnify:CR=1 FL=1